MNTRIRDGFTLIEILIVVVIMAILAATIIPQFTDSTADAEISTAEFNLNTLRAQIELYKAQHSGTPPTHDAVAKAITGLTTSTPGVNGKSYGPYMVAMPENPITSSRDVIAGSSPIVSTDVTDAAGWIYDPVKGEIRIDHTDHWTK